MERITYDEAAKMLAVSPQTLKQALEPDRRALTRAGRRGVQGLLVKEQVKLYLGKNPRTGKKKRLSLNALTKEELELWHKIDREIKAEAGQFPPVTSGGMSEDEMRRVARQELAETIEAEKLDAASMFISVMESINAIKDGGGLQGDFFTKHPVLATISQTLLVVASLAAAVVLYNEASEKDKRAIRAYLTRLDQELEEKESQPLPPIDLAEIRAKREKIARFKEQIAAA